MTSLPLSSPVCRRSGSAQSRKPALWRCCLSAAGGLRHGASKVSEGSDVELKRFSYSLVRYVPDVVRGEIVNLGVVVISEEDGQAGSRFIPRDRQRIGLLDPNADAEFVQELVDGIARRFTGTYQPTLGETQSEPITTAAALSQLGSVLRNQIQLGPPARYRGA